MHHDSLPHHLSCTPQQVALESRMSYCFLHIPTSCKSRFLIRTSGQGFLMCDGVNGTSHFFKKTSHNFKKTGIKKQKTVNYFLCPLRQQGNLCFFAVLRHFRPNLRFWTSHISICLCQNSSKKEPPTPRSTHKALVGIFHQDSLKVKESAHGRFAKLVIHQIHKTTKLLLSFFTFLANYFSQKLIFFILVETSRCN